jgi:transcription elongation factor GreA-like protein/transcription elongation GreA/GreB family factor
MEGLCMSYLKDFETQIENRDYAGFLRLWEEYCASDEIDPEEIGSILKKTKASEFAEPFGRYVEKILPLWAALNDSPLKHTVFTLIIDLETTNHETLRQMIFDYLKNRWGHLPNFNDKIRLVGLRSKESFQHAVSSFELLNHMEKGKYVFHTGGWGVGEILDVSLLREQLGVEFEYIPVKKDLSFSNAFKNLIPIPDDHFLALRFGKPDLLEEKAKENPVEVIRVLLRDLGPKTAAEIKDELCELVIPEKEWVKWWQTARAKLKKDTMVQMPEDIRDSFVLRQTEVSHEEQLQKALESKSDPAALIPTIYAFLRDFPETLKNTEFKSNLLMKIQETLEAKELTESQIVQLDFFLEDLSTERNFAPSEQVVQKVKSLEAFIQDIDILSFKKRVLMMARKVRSDWKELFLNLLFTIDQNPLRDYLFSELLNPETERQLHRKLEDLWVHPSRYPELFLWYFQKIMADPKLPYADKEGKCRFFEAFFVLLSHLEHGGAHKDLVKKMVTILTGSRYAIVREIMQGASLEAVSEFVLLATKCHSISDHDIKILHSLAEVVHPSLGKMRKKSETAPEDSVIWTTEAGYKKVKERIQQIATVETVANAKEIEVARAHGDLRENAEFKSALEKRARLQGELKTLSDQLNQARILTTADITTNEVGVGTEVECKNKQGKSATYTLLGPWDADPEKSILSFQSKLAQTMNGLTIGDKFQFQGEEFTITAIRSYLK